MPGLGGAFRLWAGELPIDLPPLGDAKPIGGEASKPNQKSGYCKGAH